MGKDSAVCFLALAIALALPVPAAENPKAPPTPGPMLERGTMGLDTPDFIPYVAVPIDLRADATPLWLHPSKQDLSSVVVGSPMKRLRKLGLWKLKPGYQFIGTALGCNC
jgi:hypothetical protein